MLWKLLISENPKKWGNCSPAPRAPRPIWTPQTNWILNDLWFWDTLGWTQKNLNSQCIWSVVSLAIFTMRMDTLTKQCFWAFFWDGILIPNMMARSLINAKKSMSGPRQSLIKISFDENLRKQASTQIAVILKLPVWRVIALKWPSWSKIYLLFVILTASSSCHIRGGKEKKLAPKVLYICGRTWFMKNSVKRAKWYTRRSC